jgi:hypothetical protein
MRFIHRFLLIGTTLLLPINFAFSADTPNFQENILTIPTINTPEQVGQFQDVRFELTPQGTWQLLEFKQVGTQGLGLAGIVDKVEKIKTESFPVQILLRVTGYFSNGCPSIGQINHRLTDNHFDVVINSISSTEFIICTAAIEPFRRIIPLPVYGLSAGIYTYSINNDNVGTFELTQDNGLPGNCDGAFECQDVELTF